MNILVTGAAGYVGSVLTPLLASRGHRVVAVDSDIYRLRRLADALPADSPTVLDASTLDQLAAQPELFSGVEAVIHLAGVSSDTAAERDRRKTWHVNVRAAGAVARTAKAAGVRRFLFASTAAIFQVRIDHPLAATVREEDGPTAPEPPLGVYARSKLVAERELAALAEENFLVILVRKGSLYGYSPVMRWDLVINRLVLAAWLGRPFVLHDGGIVWRPIAHVHDAARAYLHLLEIQAAEVNGALFAVAERNARLVDLCQEIDTMTRKTLGRGVILQPGRSPLPQRTGLVSAASLRRLGWFPRRCLGDAVGELLYRLDKHDVDLPKETTAAGVGGAVRRRAAW